MVWINQPIYLTRLEELNPRIPALHSSRLEFDRILRVERSGFQGEKSLDYYFSFLESKDVFILHNKRLYFNGHHFQMDFILLSPKLFLIVEVKNNGGIVYVDEEFDQMINIVKGKETRFQNPITQVNHQRFQLHDFLQSEKLPAIPIETLVVMSNPHCILKSAPNQMTPIKNLIHREKMIEYIKTQMNQYPNKKLNGVEIDRIVRLLKKRNEPYNPNVLEKLKIPYSDLIKGVPCPICGQLAMKYINGKWICPHCNHTSTDAHLKALDTYKLLVGPTITNSQFRDFCGIGSRDAAYRLLKKLNLKVSGKGSGTIYFIN